jgi:hypothetical protein
VLDVNDNAPQFGPTLGLVTLPENSPEQTIVFAKEARDRDSGLNGRVNYRLVKVSECSCRHPETRLLRLAKRETKNGGNSQNSPYIEFKEKRLSPLLEIVNAIFYSSADKFKARNIAISKVFK